jgi:hypothetical protein
MRRVEALAFGVLLLSVYAQADILPRTRTAARPHGSPSQRRRLHVNSLITAPGTAEVEWDNLYSFTSGNYSMPSSFKFTPAGGHILWGRTEYSAAFDSLDSTAFAGGRANQFSDRLSFAATSVILDTAKLDIAIAPQATFFLRGESGVRLGATVLARYDSGLNSLGATAAWSFGTSPSGTNPAGAWDFGAGFGRKLASAGILNRLTPHVNTIYDRSTGFRGTLAGFAGMEYQVTPRVAVDFSGQRLGLTGGTADRQVVVGLTVNLGRLQ